MARPPKIVAPEPIAQESAPEGMDATPAWHQAQKVWDIIRQLFERTWKRIDDVSTIMDDHAQTLTCHKKDSNELRKALENHAATLTNLLDDGKKLRASDLKTIRTDIEGMQQKLTEIRQEREVSLANSMRQFQRLCNETDILIAALRECTNMVKGKRDLNYITVDEYLLEIEPTRRGPISDEARQQHETRLDTLMKKRMWEPGKVHAPGNKIHRTYPRDLIVTYVTNLHNGQQ